MKRLLALPALLVLLATTACSKFDEAIDAYYAGDYKKAVSILKPYAVKEEKKQPAFDVSIDKPADIEKAISKLTKKYFVLWQAYAGSLFGLEKTDEGCKNTLLSLRKISVTINDKNPALKFDPREGDFWPAETFTLRSWAQTVPCLEYARRTQN
jgi:hypothetical protein